MIATAEPLGSYHLESLHTEMRAASANGHGFCHLIPYPEPVQGRGWDDTTSALSVLEHADLVVITGGGFTAWSELVARRCQQLGVRFVVSELAYGAQPDGLNHPKPYAVSALSPAGAENLARYHEIPVNDIVVTGTPLLDAMPPWQPEPGRVLVLSSVDVPSRDPDRVLMAFADTLMKQGHEIVVRCHPREDPSLWAGYVLDESPSVVLAARHAELVIGYPGSAHPIVAALGVPVIAVAPTQALRDALPPAQASVIPTWAHGLSDLEKLADARSTSQEYIEYANGPIGGSAKRMVSFWLAQAQS